MKNFMMNKINHLFEFGTILITIHWQPVFGILSSCIIFLYYGSKLKIDVVDKKYGGSWKKYFKSLIKIK